MVRFSLPAFRSGALLAVAFSVSGQEDALLLPPATMLIPESALPEYEATIDHARLIQ